MRIKLLCTLLVLITAPLAVGAPGDLDPTFGTNGILSLSQGAQEDLAHGLLVLPPGGIVVSGYGAPLGDQFRIAQFTASGQPDPSFGTAGRVIVTVGQFAPNSNPADALLRDGSGKLVVIGARTFGNCRLIIARLNADGSLDASFGTLGIAEDISYGGVVCSAHSATLLSDAKILVAGNDCCAYYGLVLTRRLTNGTADSSFGIGGVSKPVNDLLTGLPSMVVDTQGRILVAASAAPFRSGGPPVIRRFTPLGAPDLTFGASGAASPPVANGAFTALVRQSDGDLVAAGYTPDQALVARFSSDGAPDGTFGNAGVVLAQAGGAYPIAALTLQPDGKIIIAYGGTLAGTPGLWLTRLLPSGAPDATFGAAGSTFTPLITAPTARAMTMQSDGKVLVLVAPNLLLRFDAANVGVVAAVSRVEPLDATFAHHAARFRGV